jgi:hypothetical protein
MQHANRSRDSVERLVGDQAADDRSAEQSLLIVVRHGDAVTAGRARTCGGPCRRSGVARPRDWCSGWRTTRARSGTAMSSAGEVCMASSSNRCWTLLPPVSSTRRPRVRWPPVGPPVVLATLDLTALDEVSLDAGAELVVDGAGTVNAVA